MTTQTIERLSTGVEGLDDVLEGGFLPRRAYLVRGPPGAGKSLFGLRFLAAGADAGENVLLIALEEDQADVRQNAAAVGIDLSGVEVIDLSPGSDYFVESRTYDVFAPDEGEGADVIASTAERIAEFDPERVVLDPVTQLRHLSPDAYQFRRQTLSFVRFLREQDATVLFTSQGGVEGADEDLPFLSDGIVDLQTSVDGRWLTVPKYRGSGSRGGRHAYRITEAGIEVFPRLVPERHGRGFTAERISSGVPDLDELLGGGIERGTVTILSGPTGVGKTTLGTQFMKESAGRGERSVVYLFEEGTQTFFERSSSVNIPVRQMVENGTLAVEEIEPLERSASQFAHDVREEVERGDSGIVMIDGVDGYRMSLHDETDSLMRKLHAMCRYLKKMGVTVILIDETGSVTGDFRATSENISYLADNIVFLRYLELSGELRKAIGVLKKRTGDFEHTLREFRITEHGLKVGEPLSDLRGVLRGTPEWTSPPDSRSGRVDDV